MIFHFTRLFSAFTCTVFVLFFGLSSKAQQVLHIGQQPQSPQLFEAKISARFPQDQGLIKVLGYLGDETWLISKNNQTDIPHWITNLKPYPAEKKYQDGVLDWAEKKGPLFRLRVKTFFKSKIDVDEKTKQLGILAAPFQILEHAGIFEIWVKDEQELNLLAAEDWVYYIGAVTIDHTLNQDAQSITNAHQAKLPLGLGGSGLSGKGVVIGIGDDGKNEHGDVDSRIVQHFNPIVGSGHSVHVGLTAAGAGIIDERYAGFAPEADIISHFFNAVLIYGPTMYQDFGMTLTNNSYGSQQGNCAFAGTYNEVSAYLDEMAHTHPELLHIFAAGNDGNKNCAPYPLGFGTVLGGYQPSKNTLSVANMGKGFSWYHPTSSKGPVKDGRLKPELAAVGRLVVSGGLNNTYVTNTGTSMACPNVTGAAALITEAYREKNAGQNPDNALLKIALMNGSKDIYHHGPDYKYGYGMLDVQASLDIVNNDQYQKFEITQDETHSLPIIIPEGVTRLKVMVYWNDLPAVPTEDQSISRLMNNLDMQLLLPEGDVLLPWILNPANPDAPAVRGIDTLNNSEQITVENPSASTYQIAVTGSRILEGSQSAYIAWSFEYDELTILHPVGEEKLINSDSLRVVFKTAETSSTFSCFFSSDNGSSWTLLSGSIPSSHREFMFLPNSSIHSDQCKILVVENATGKTDTSASFVISGRLEASLAEESEQCPGSATIVWTNVPYAEDFVLFQEINGVMKPIDTVAATQNSYTYSGLDISKKQWFAVAPRIGAKTAIRSIALSRTPNSGECLHSSNPTEDLALLHIESPKNGRAFTSTALGAAEQVEIKIRNQGKTTLTSINLAYRFNEEEAVTELFSVNLAPGKDTLITFATVIDGIESSSIHDLEIYHISSSDAELRHNDTLEHQFAQLVNEPVHYLDGLIENFETLLNESYTQQILGIAGSHRWDFEKTSGYGRLKTFVNSDVCVNGTRAVTLDLYRNAAPSFDSVSTNALIGTFNLSEIDLEGQEMRMDFYYRFAGRPKYQEGNELFIRGKDTDPWLPVIPLDTTFSGSLKYAGAFSLNDILSAGGQSFSSSTQIKISQRDTSLIAGVDFGNALTVDSFRLYPVSNDVSMESIRAPKEANCALGNAEQLSVEIRNNVYYPLENVAVSYRINGGPIRTENITMIPAKTTVSHTFSTLEDFSEKGIYKIDAWVNAFEDSYPANDSLLNQSIYHLEIIDEFNYVETFESASQNYFTNDSSAFVLDTPYSAGIRTAANGHLCWSASNITSDTAKAKSYLYSPCFDISTLEHPYISFSFSGNFPMQDSTTALAAAWLEYATESGNWQKLGAENTGYNWYNHTENYWAYGFHHWKVVTHALPVTDGSIKFRWVFESFSGSRSSNFAIDDVHIYDEPQKEIWSERGIFTQDISLSSGVETKIETDQFRYVWLESTTSGSSYKMSMHNHETPILSSANEVIIPTSFAFIGPNKVSAKAHFFVPHSSVEMSKNADCGCQKTDQIYGNGISVYSSENLDELNGSLEDNLQGSYTFIAAEDIEYIPYRNGYIVKANVDLPSEIWFNSGGATGQENIGFVPVELSGSQTNNLLALMRWVSQTDSTITDYFLERKNEDGAFITIAHLTKNIENKGVYQYLDQPILVENNATYRLRYIDNSGITRLTREVTLNWIDGQTFAIYPNPVTESTIHIGYKLTQIEPIDIAMYDMSGKRIFLQKESPNTEQGIITIQLGNLGIAAGTYILKIKISNEEFSEKIIFLK